jgi:integrase
MEAFALKPRTRENARALLHAIFTSAVEEELIEKNPVPRIFGLNVDADPLWRDEARWEKNEIDELCDNPAIAPLHQEINALLYCCALRVSELSAITLSAINWKKRPLPALSIVESFNTAERATFDPKSKVPRAVPLLPRAQEAIDRIASRLMPLILGRAPLPNEPLIRVFSRKLGMGNLRNDTAWHWLEQDCEAIGIRRRGTHTFRVSAISALAELGVPWPIIEKISHATPSGAGLDSSISPTNRAIKGYMRPSWAAQCDWWSLLPQPQRHERAQFLLPLLTRIR